jgi:hypothetical protein
MLDIRITVDEESNFTGCITLYFNQGGIRNVTKQQQEKVLAVIKDSFNPHKAIFERPTST